MVTRRRVLARSAEVATLLAAAGLLPAPARAAWSQAAFEAKSLADAVKALGGAAPAESKDVTLTGPDIAENGAVVPMACACRAARRQAPAAAGGEEPQRAGRRMFDVSDAIEANVATRVKMGQSSQRVCRRHDGRRQGALSRKKEVKVTLGGCGG